MRLGDPTHGLKGTELERVRLAGDALHQLNAFWDAAARTDAIKAIADTSDAQRFETSGIPESRELLALARGPAVVLEVGCGIGRVMQHLAPECAEVHGVDISAEMVEHGARRLARFANVMFHKGNGYDLGMFEDDTFDLVYSQVVFQHLPKTIAYNYMTEIRRVLKPNGIFRLQVPNLLRDDHFDAFRHFTQPYFVEHPYPMNFYTPSEVAMMLSKAELALESISDDIVAVARKSQAASGPISMEVVASLEAKGLAKTWRLFEDLETELARMRRITNHWSVRLLLRVRLAIRSLLPRWAIGSRPDQPADR